MTGVRPQRHSIWIWLCLACAASLTTAKPASADATAFLGLASAPEARRVTGLAVGSGLLVVGFEFEYAQTQEQLEDAAPGVRTFMGNLLVQTPVPVHGIQFYGTIGAGLYRESLGESQTETNLGTNVGGGAKVTLAGPLRLRLDYRAFLLRGAPLHDQFHRLYAGLNLAF